MLIVGIVAALWAASGYVGAFMRASNIIYEVDEGRAIWKLRPLQMFVTLLMILLIAVAAVGVVVTGPVAEAVGGAIGVGDTAVTVWNIAKWPVLLAIITVMLAVLYYASPNAKVGRFKFITPGAIVAVVIWIVASLAFGVLRRELRLVRQDLRLARRRRRVPRVALHLERRDPFGAELNAERERSEQIERGRAGRRARPAPGAARRAEARSRRQQTACADSSVPLMACGSLPSMRDRRRTTAAVARGRRRPRQRGLRHRQPGRRRVGRRGA